jgi:hypothetical protein
MVKIMNVVFGIGIAIILYIVVLLGINVFYPAPNFMDYNCTAPQEVKLQVCDPSMTVGDCYYVVAGKQLNESITSQQAKFDECEKKFQEDDKIYGRNFFYITNVVGILVVTGGLLLFIYFSSMINLGVGAAFAGLALIFFGFIRGWEGTSDKLKFVLGLIIAAIVITYSIIVNKRYSSKKK